MSAHWPVTSGEAIQPEPPSAPLRRIGLGVLFRATARRHPERLAFIDPADKAAWSGRPASTWTYGAAADRVGELARGLRAWRLTPGSRIGLCLPAGAESALAYLAVLEAGHIPCLLPITWDEERLVTATRTVGIAAILTQSRLGSIALAERLCSVAARYFGLRYLAAFGPDTPDGVIDLDERLFEPSESQEPIATPEPGLVSFVAGDPESPVYRGSDAVVAAAAAHLVAVRPAPAERIVSLLGMNDLRGLVTGLAAALVAGTSLETGPVFDGAGFAATLVRPVATHLVVPAFLERTLGERTLPESVRSIVFAHRAPFLFADRWRRDVAGDGRMSSTIDAVAFDETAVVSGRRGSGGDLTLMLEQPDRLALPRGLLEIRAATGEGLAFRGQACATAPLQRGKADMMSPGDWRMTAYEPRLSAGLLTGIGTRAVHAETQSPFLFAIA